MCVINGIIDLSNQNDPNQLKTIIKKMNSSITSQGSEDDSLTTIDNIGLGFKHKELLNFESNERLIFSDDKSLALIFKGNIYNYKELKNDLILKGHVFKTNSDTEVVLHSYIEYGTSCFSYFSGVFALAVYDTRKKKTIIARDRAGEKSLYYHNSGQLFLFSSELKSLLISGKINKVISKKALNQYLQLTYIPAPLSIFENVFKVLPGHYIEIDSKGHTSSNQYWDVQYKKDNLILDYDECKKILRDTLFHAVEDTMVSDEPIGTFLSGGIDSTIITGIVSKLSKNPIDTFTIGYNNKRNDESSLSSLASQLHKTNPHIFYLNYEDVLPELDKLIDNLDEPFADSSYIPTYMVSKFAKQHVRTVLTGDSGEELFGGYSKYLIGHYAEKYNKVPKWCRTMFEHAVYRVPDTLSITRKLRKVIVNADKDIFEQRKELMCLGFKDYELQALLTEEYKVDDSLSFIKGYYDTLQIVDDELSNALYTDFKVVLEGDMLPKVSRASKLASLETRVPMLHKDVVELAARIPSRFKINTNNTKIILKDTSVRL